MMTMSEFKKKVGILDDLKGSLEKIAEAAELTELYFKHITPWANITSASYKLLYDPNNANASTADHANLKDKTLKKYKKMFSLIILLLIDDGEVPLLGEGGGRCC